MRRVTRGARRQRIRRRRVTPSSRLLLGFCAAGVGRAWNAASGQLLRTLAPPGGPRPPRVIGWTSNVRAAVLLCWHLLLVYDVTSGHVVAATTTDGACRRLRATPRGGAIVGVTGRRAESVLVSTDGACAPPDVAAGRQKHSVRDVLIPPWLPSTRHARILDMRSMSVSMPIRNF